MSQPEWQTYVRWRPRMVRQSVYEDIVTTLTDTGWYVDPDTVGTINLLEGHPLQIRDDFPDEAEYQDRSIAMNTLALDNGVPGEEYEFELGGMHAQDYTFTMALYAASDAMAMALFQDLADRYLGRLSDPYVTLYNYMEATPTQVLRMEVESFRFNRSVEQVAPGFELYFAELIVTDFVGQKQVVG